VNAGLGIAGVVQVIMSVVSYLAGWMSVRYAPVSGLGKRLLWVHKLFVGKSTKLL